MRLIKYSTPFLAILGLVLLSFMGKTYGVQSVKIKDLTRKSNYAQIRLTGRVSGDIRFHASATALATPLAADTSADAVSETDSSSGGSLEFEVDDGTDTIRVRALGEVSDEVKAAGKVPGMGDQVELIGSYQYKARRHFIILGSANDLQVRRERPEAATPIGWLRNPEEKGLKENQRLKITGRIQNVRPGQYDRSLLMGDPFGAAISVSLSAGSLEARGADDPAVKFCEGLQVGDYVTCYGTLARSKSRMVRTWLVSPAAPDDLIAADEQAWRHDNGNP